MQKCIPEISENLIYVFVTEFTLNTEAEIPILLFIYFTSYTFKIKAKGTWLATKFRLLGHDNENKGPLSLILHPSGKSLWRTS